MSGLPEPRKRILFVINSLVGGGAERVMLTLLAASESMRSEYDFSLALLDDIERRYDPPAGLRIHQLDARLGLVRSIRELSRLVAKERPHATVSFLTRSNVATVAVAKRYGHRAIISERTHTSGHFDRGVRDVLPKRIVRVSYPAADHIIAVSRGIADDLSDNFGVDPAKISTIANPIASASIRAAASEPWISPVNGPYGVVVGRLIEGKNVTMLVEALAASGLDMSLVVVGEGPERERILARAASLGIQNKVILTGFLSNPFPIVRTAACYLSASNREGFPNGLVEALTLGVPTVATNCAYGPSEVLDDKRREEIVGLHHGKYGIVAPLGDVQRMAEAMRAMADPNVARKYAEAGPVRARAFDVEIATQRYWEVITRVLGA